MKLAIVGHGFVGKAVDYGFTHPALQKVIIDPIYDGISVDGYYPNVDKLKDFNPDLTFVCVPTPMGKDGKIYSSIIENVVTFLKQNITGIIVIKSTITPDIIKKMRNGIHHRVVYNPEFLTEKSAQEQFVNPQMHIFGGDRIYTNKVEEYYNKYSLCNLCPSYHMTVEEASFVKYSINSFLAMKVIFFNQLYDAMKSTEADFHTVIKAIGADKRIGSSHTKVPGFDGKQGFGGACFPKDVSALINYSPEFTLLEKCVKINNEYRKKYNLDDREKEQQIRF